MKINNGNTQQNLEKVAKELGCLLADEYLLFLKAQNAHWNVECPDFQMAHDLFENQYTELINIVDSIAERIRTIGMPVYVINAFFKNTVLTQSDTSDTKSASFITQLLCDHESIIAKIRKNIGPFEQQYNDAGSSDFINCLMQRHEKMAWILRSHLM